MAQNELPNYDSLNVKVLKKIGSGTYGDVYSVLYENQQYAMKVFKGVCPISPTEIDIPSRVKSPYISKIMHIMHYKENGYENIFLLYKLYNDSMRDFIKDMSDENLINKINVFYKILQGVYALHCNRIIHMDIKIDNILMTLENGVHIPHITDFGLSRYTGNVNTGLDFSNITDRVHCMGTTCYLPPEHFRGTNIYGGFTDIWALGVLAIRMFFGKKLIPDSIKKEGVPTYVAVLDDEKKIKNRLKILFKNLPEGKNYKKYENNIKKLIKQMLSPDHIKRPKIEELFIHPLFYDIDNEISFNYVLKDQLPFMNMPPFIINIIVEYYTKRSIFETENDVKPNSRSLALNFFEAINLAYKIIAMTNRSLLDKENNQSAIGLACVILTLGNCCVDPKVIIKRIDKIDISLNRLEVWIKYIINKTHGALRSDTNLFHVSESVNDLKKHLENTIYNYKEYIIFIKYNLSQNSLNGFITFNEIMNR